MVEKAGPVDTGAARVGFIPELHALRGALAFWVFAAHLLGDAEGTLALRVLGAGGLAVDGFIMLSGFVIAMTLRDGKVSYRAFITRRVFRLFPVLAVCVVLALVVHALAGPRLVREFPDTPLRILLVLGMVQGMVPDALLSCAARSVLGPAWSISLEWQFYLIAPALIGFMGAGAGSAHGGRPIALGRTMIVAAGTLAGAWVSFRMLSFCGTSSFLPMRLGYFLVGILSAQAWLALRGAGAETLHLVFAGLVALIFAFIPSMQLLTLLPWVAVLYASLAERDPLARPLQALLHTSPIQQLGSISFSLYLVHMPVIHAVQVLADATTLPPFWRAGLMVVLAVVITLVAAAGIWKWVELPCIALGRRVAALGRPVAHPA
ncbi:acyltransferase family protein [Dankookia sp. GCM10030260]|uniref:acyltransferase family protein n=1 Tax=Dankookia sp. GCM10030260 TaxID=3273390 RepID=UPI003614FF6B